MGSDRVYFLKNGSQIGFDELFCRGMLPQCTFSMSIVCRNIGNSGAFMKFVTLDLPPNRRMLNDTNSVSVTVEFENTNLKVMEIFSCGLLVLYVLLHVFVLRISRKV